MFGLQTTRGWDGEGRREGGGEVKAVQQGVVCCCGPSMKQAQGLGFGAPIGFYFVEPHALSYVTVETIFCCPLL